MIVQVQDWKDKDRPAEEEQEEAVEDQSHTLPCIGILKGRITSSLLRQSEHETQLQRVHSQKHVTSEEPMNSTTVTCSSFGTACSKT